MTIKRSGKATPQGRAVRPGQSRTMMNKPLSFSEPNNAASFRPGWGCLHSFRSKVLDLANLDGRLIAATERGAYMLDKNGKRWRKVKV